MFLFSVYCSLQIRTVWYAESRGMVKGALASFIMLSRTGHCFQVFGICKNHLVNSSVDFLMPQTSKNEISLSSLKKTWNLLNWQCTESSNHPCYCLPKMQSHSFEDWNITQLLNLSFSFARAWLFWKIRIF